MSLEDHVVAELAEIKAAVCRLDKAVRGGDGTGPGLIGRLDLLDERQKTCPARRQAARRRLTLSQKLMLIITILLVLSSWIALFINRRASAGVDIKKLTQAIREELRDGKP